MTAQPESAPGSADGRQALPDRNRPLCRRPAARARDLRVLPAFAACPCEDQEHRHLGRQGDAGRGRDLHRQGYRRRQGRRPDLRLGGQGQARPAAQGAAASGDGARYGALCRRHGRDGRGQQPRRGQGRRRGDQGRLRGDAGQRRSRQGARQGRARGPRRSAGQPDLRLGDRREGRCRCRLRQGRARHQARHRQQPPDPQRHGAARRGGGLRQGHRQLHALVDVAEPARAAPHPVGLRARHSRAQAARGGARRRRRLRQQDLLLQRRDDGDLGGVPRRPADQVDGRAQRIVPDRCARPRPRHPCRAGARQGRQVPGAQGRHHRQHGRVSLDLLDGGADLPLRDAAGRPVHDAADLRQREGGADAHRAGRRLSRRRPSRGDLRHREHRQQGGGGDEDRSGRAAPEELHSDDRLPVPDAGGAAVRLGQLPADHRRGDQDRRLQGLRGAARRGQVARQAARHRLLVLHRGLRPGTVAGDRPAGRRRRPVGVGADQVQPDRQRPDPDRRAQPRPEPRDDLRPDRVGQARRADRDRSRSSTATRRRRRSAWAPTARARWRSAARPS